MEKQIELEQTHSQLKHLEGVLEEMNTKLGLCEKENEGEAVVEGSFSKKLREAIYWAISVAMTLASIIIGLGATVVDWKPMAAASFFEFIGAALASAIGELLTMWSDKKTIEALLKLAKSPPLLPALLSENHTLRMWMVVVVATAIFLLIGIVGSETNGDQQPPSIDDPNWRLDLLQDLADYAD
ncbi:hypothetical protein CRG98_026572 [Punica granatum]|uniref:Transmembrane protein n=1 Tax=Punica granatum TaxID=22663 RepID=A0A2I0J9Q8_PUNGR|nr:hypothetical protein CRG98_026572 [Punica granatum]